MENDNDKQKFICDGELEIVRITEEYYDEAMDVFKENFIKNENLVHATGLGENPEAIAELLRLFRGVMKAGISFGAKDPSNNRLAGVCMNKVMNPPLGYTLDEYFSSFKTNEMTCIGKCLDRVENSFNIYQNWNIDCAFEIVFLCTRIEYERKGIGKSLAGYSIDVARKMAQSQEISSHLRPKAVCSVFTSICSQKIGAKLNFELITEIPYKEFSFEGRSFVEKIPASTDRLTFAALRL